AKVMILSVPEGHDKPYKYPNIFAIAEAVILNKYDTLSVFDFDEDEFRTVVRSLNAAAPIFPTSATKGDGIDAWAEWLAARIEGVRVAGA
ncbi:MAG: GTP-binding protein, partial [Coriobacteriia bacterium]|nr:GTP-binding protein [Coriobacteriia bacterium]